jgi:hypothetical protein
MVPMALGGLYFSKERHKTQGSRLEGSALLGAPPHSPSPHRHRIPALNDAEVLRQSHAVHVILAAAGRQVGRHKI